MTEKKKILVVDDDEGIRESLSFLFECEGYDVECAVDGADALDRLGRGGHFPSLIILDLMMPVMDGIAFRIEQLRQPKFAKVPVLMLSANSCVHDKIAGLSMNACCRKPFDIDVLLALVKKHEREPGATGADANAGPLPVTDPRVVAGAGVDARPGAH